MSLIGIVPARMASSRFPGKPLAPIAGRPMLEHCFLRARLWPRWDALAIATCDREIAAFAEERRWPVIWTADTHVRALDRVAEAATKAGVAPAPADIIVCVQGDEPLLGPDMIEAVVGPLEADPAVLGTLLAVPIGDQETFLNPDTVKLVHDLAGNVLYTSRSPIPYARTFARGLGAKRVGGIFGFRRPFLEWFTATPESPLEAAESCDSNRFYDHGRRQRIGLAPDRAYLSVDSPGDVALVEAAMTAAADPYHGRY